MGFWDFYTISILFFLLKNQKKLHNAFLMNKLQQKNHLMWKIWYMLKLIFANYYIIFFFNILSEGAVNTLFSKKLFFCHLFHGLGFKRLSSCLSSVVCVWISAVWCLFLLRTRRVFSFLSTPVSTATIPSTFTKPKRDASNYICGDSVLVLNHTSFMNLYLCKWHQTRL